MDEKLKTKEMLEAEIRTCIEDLKHVTRGSDEYTRLAKDIQQLVAAYVQLEETENDKIDSDRRFREDIRQKDLDRDYKDMLERDKMRVESEARKEEVKENRKSGWRDAGVKIAIGVGSLALYGTLAALGLRLEFIENGSITGFTLKELFRILHPKPTIM